MLTFFFCSLHFHNQKQTLVCLQLQHFLTLLLRQPAKQPFFFRDHLTDCVNMSLCSFNLPMASVLEVFSGTPPSLLYLYKKLKSTTPQRCFAFPFFPPGCSQQTRVLCVSLRGLSGFSRASARLAMPWQPNALLMEQQLHMVL